MCPSVDLALPSQGTPCLVPFVLPAQLLTLSLSNPLLPHFAWSPLFLLSFPLYFQVPLQKENVNSPALGLSEDLLVCLLINGTFVQITVWSSAQEAVCLCTLVLPFCRHTSLHWGRCQLVIYSSVSCMTPSHKRPKQLPVTTLSPGTTPFLLIVSILMMRTRVPREVR